MQQHEVTWEPTQKQMLALRYLEDDKTTELFYGGAAGGGKSYLGCAWILLSLIKYPGTRWMMGRAKLKSLKETTLLTFFELCATWGLEAGTDFKYNTMMGVIHFSNGSEIYLKDLFAYPSDPQFDSFGSTEYTGVFIDEGSQITNKAKNIVMSRIRYKLEEFNIVPKMLIASNPSKNFLYYDFYKPWKTKELKEYRKFIPALVGDNKHISPHYIENLKKLDRVSKERLLHGNFEYDDDPARLIEYDSIIDIFTNTRGKEPGKFITVDIARLGPDYTTIWVWEGFHIKRMVSFKKQRTTYTEDKIEKIRKEEGIPRSKVVADEDGVGGGVVDHLSGIKGFVNNSSTIEKKRDKDKHNYRNLKSQCYFLLADYINNGRISCFSEIDPKIKEMLIQDLEQVKRKNVDDDGPLQVIGKKEIKENIGRSPDFGDAMMMRMYFVVKKSGLAFAFGSDMDKTPTPA